MAPSRYMNQARGGFLKPLRAFLLEDHSEVEAFATAVAELGNACIYCGIQGNLVPLQPDHFWPQWIGGLTVRGNVAPAWGACNSKRNRQPWERFLAEKHAQLVRQRRPSPDSSSTLARVRSYMAKYCQTFEPSLEQSLTPEQSRVYESCVLLLKALSDGAMAVLGHAKPSDINFNEPATLFAELVEVAKAHSRLPIEAAPTETCQEL